MQSKGNAGRAQFIIIFYLNVSFNISFYALNHKTYNVLKLMFLKRQQLSN